MKNLFIFLSVVIVGAGYFFSVLPKSNNTWQEDLIAYKKRFAISCSPDLYNTDFSADANSIPLLDGWGDYKMIVTASNDSSNIYFQQGLNMYYGFHIIEAISSFEKAIKFDSNFAMGYWGKALAYGPNINDMFYKASPKAFKAIKKANEISETCTPIEKALINALEFRYSLDKSHTRESLNQSYASAMKKVYLSFPLSADAATLYVDALMLLHPWDLYTKKNEPKMWTPEIVSTLEKILLKFPDHPGASHYYIHAIEGSAHPEKAIAVADNLVKLMPGVAHVAHMPSHIYIRTGKYKEGEKVNELAVKGYQNYLAKFPMVSNNFFLYLLHNLHMQATCANLNGKYQEAMKLSVECRNGFDSGWQLMPGVQGLFLQYLYMTPYLTSIRFGKWDDILNVPEVNVKHVYSNLLWHYGQGLAYTRKHDFANAHKHLAAVQKALTNDYLKMPVPSIANTAISTAEIAGKILQGVIQEEQNNLTESIIFLRQAVELEDDLLYNEPKDWVHPARQYLGSVLLKDKKYLEAQKVFDEDLLVNPNNGWSLTGLAKSFSGQGKKKKAAAVQKQADEAFSECDTKIENAVF